MDRIYQQMYDDTEIISEKSQEGSEIKKLFSGQTVFLTGCTGFIGKCLTEKLLRETELKKLFVLIRPKEELSVEQRLDKFFQDEVFEPLRKMVPDFARKVEPIMGDLAKKDIGLSEKDRKKLTEETTIIIHNGSTTKFYERISNVLKINVLGTQHLLDLAIECKTLKAFTYISSAFSNSNHDVEERFYDPPVDLRIIPDLIASDESLPGGLTEETVNQIIGGSFNTYTFSKALAENIVKEYSRKVAFPCAVHRPGLVISAYREPIKGWVDDSNGPVTGFVAASLGLLHVIHCNSWPKDFIPVDMTVNSILASTWDVIINQIDAREAVVYNYGSSIVNPITLHRMQELVEVEAYEKPSDKMVWAYFCSITSCVYYFYLMDMLTHLLPALIIDGALLLQGKRPKALQAYFQFRKQLNFLTKGLTSKQVINCQKSKKVWNRLNPVDSDLFFCDIRNLDWDEFAETFWLGMRLFILKDPLNTVESGRSKFKKLRIFNILTVTATFLIFLYLVNRVTGILSILC
ncbi:fatty acyl-CoA reductase wat [Orussus abietinus]|uniref:fatty acyl-CoA reductase wat n=1 Tax=Orussus abietinus TaxID=222816 RepID=UPI000625B3A8|nr:fatty acyl-CoA reductase wat [Orussus abietinus]